MATAPIMGCRTILTEQGFNLPHGLAALLEARCPSAVCFTTRRTQSSSRPGEIYIVYLARLNPNTTHRICNTIKTTIDYLLNSRTTLKHLLYFRDSHRRQASCTSLQSWLWPSLGFPQQSTVRQSRLHRSQLASRGARRIRMTTVIPSSSQLFMLHSAKPLP
jgi:hypothetical protein